MKAVLAHNDTPFFRRIAPQFIHSVVAVETATNGMDALELINTSKPDLLIIDECFSHREWLLGILQEEASTAELPLLDLPEKAQSLLRMPDSRSGANPLIPVPVGTWFGLNPEELHSFSRDAVNYVYDQGNPDHREAMREFIRFREVLQAQVKLLECRRQRSQF